LSCRKDTIIFKAIKKLRRAIIARRSLSLAEKYQIKFQVLLFAFGTVFHHLFLLFLHLFQRAAKPDFFLGFALLTSS
jgi:hypothetical protein